MIPHAIIIVFSATVAFPFPFAWATTGWQTRKPVHDRRDVFAEGAGDNEINVIHGESYK